MEKLSIQSSSHDEMIDITDKIQHSIPSEISGVITVYVPHTSAAITINEGADPEVQSDILRFLHKLVPWESDLFNHAEGNSAAHVKGVLVGNSVQVIVDDGKIQLGTWEKIFFCEFDGPRTRSIWINY